MAITLAEVTYDIVEQVVALKVREDQKDLVRDPRQSLNIAASEQDLRALAIYADEVLVGFCMYGTDEEDGRISVQSLMIDAAFQGKGYSSLALQALIERVREERNPAALYADILKDNGAAERIFSKSGFSKPARSRTANWSGCTATEPTGHPGFPPVSPSRAIRGGLRASSPERG
jgi:diamine N-acetyltransferase